MIYFLINNNYHLYDVKLHLNNLANFKVSLLQVPHTLDEITNDIAALFVEVFTFQRLIESKLNYVNIFRLSKLYKNIKNSLHIGSNDVLFVYTEYELLNHYLIACFKNAGAKVYIIDEGIATYLTYSMLSDKPVPVKERFKLWWLRNMLGYVNTNFLYLNGIAFPQIKDNYIDAVLLYRDIQLVRNIRKILIYKNIKNSSNKNMHSENIAVGNIKNTNSEDDKKLVNVIYNSNLTASNSVIFLNERIYDYYVSFEEYIDILNDVLKNLLIVYDIVKFKFHPREDGMQKNKILPFIQNLPGLEVIDINNPIENIIYIYNTINIASFFSVALFNLHDAGLNSIYVFHKYQALMNQPVFMASKKLLTNMHYNFFDKWEELKLPNVGFKPCDHSSSAQYTTIRDLLCLNL
ncbi:MAG: hypothetical protein QG673_1065 [Pseudomonadota bacterium]|nr:hypothetical protein [Pseudomonadota bacterium]